MAQNSRVSSVLVSRYATALLDLATDSKKEEKVAEDLLVLQKALEENAEFQTFVVSPMIKREDQHNVLAALSKKAKMEKVTANFLGVLVDNKRLRALPFVIKAYNEMLSKKRGEVVAHVKAAQELSKTQEKELQDQLKQEVGKDVSLEVKIDPSLLGGVVVTLGSKMIDDSVVRKLDRLKNAMANQVIDEAA